MPTLQSRWVNRKSERESNLDRAAAFTGDALKQEVYLSVPLLSEEIF